MSLSIKDLTDLLTQYRQRLQQAQVSIQQLTGAIGAIENQINMVVAKEGQKKQEQDNATKEGKQSKSNTAKHKDRNCSREKTSNSDGHCIQ